MQDEDLDLAETVVVNDRVPDLRDRQTVRLAEEIAVVGKRRVEGETVNIHVLTDVRSETVRADLQREAVGVERVPVNAFVAEIPEQRVVDGVTIIPVVEEVLVVEKRLRLVEEIHIRRELETGEVERDVDLRTQRAEIEITD